jgi:hypothetical protein
MISGADLLYIKIENMPKQIGLVGYFRRLVVFSVHFLLVLPVLVP